MSTEKKTYMLYVRISRDMEDELRRLATPYGEISKVARRALELGIPAVRQEINNGDGESDRGSWTT